MEDRYLFKGKTAQIVGTYNNGVENGVWVHGNLRFNAGKYTIFQFEFERADYVEYEIDPDTICQCTGLKDKNGNLIWENDIINAISPNPDGELICVDSIVVNVIDYNLMLNLYYADELECVGNIFDNPELLEGE